MATLIQRFQYQPPANDNVSQARGTRSQIRQDVQALSTALQSGDLQTAQNSYGDLQKILQGSGSISQGAASAQNSSPASSAPTTASASTTASPLDALKSDFQA